MKNRIILLLFTLIAHNLAAKPISIWISSQQDLVYYQQMVELYRQTTDANFEAKVNAYGFREMPDRLHVAMKTGENTPDIVQLDEVFFGMYLGEEVPFLDLTAKVKKAGLDKTLVKQRLDLFSHKGHVYGLPQSLSSVVLYYVKDAFEEYDITPSKIDTWSKFRREMKKLANNGRASLALDWSYLEILSQQRGGGFFSKEGRSQLSNPITVNTFQWLKDLIDDGSALLPDRGSIFDPVFFSGDIANNEAFCIIGAGWYGLDMIQQFAPDMAGEWGIMPLPAWDDEISKSKRRTSSFAGQGLMIYKDSKNTDASWEFIKFVMENKTANIQRFQMGNSFPAHKPSWKYPEMFEASDYFSHEPMANIFIPLADDLPTIYQHPKRAQAIFMLRENYFTSVMYGSQTPQEALLEIETALEKGPQH